MTPSLNRNCTKEEKIKATWPHLSIENTYWLTSVLRIHMDSPQYWEYTRTHLSIENTHGLGKVMSLHNASLAAVQSRQHRVGRDLQSGKRNQLGVHNHFIVDYSISYLILSSIVDIWCLNALISWLLEKCCLFPCGQGHGTNRRLSKEERNS